MQNPFAKFEGILIPCHPFTSSDGQTCVRIRLENGGALTLPVRSSAFRDWYFSNFYFRNSCVPSPGEFRTVLSHLDAQANDPFADRYRLPVFRRVGRRGPNRVPDKILLDLATTDRHVVEISADGWRTISGSEARFHCSRSALSLPEPQSAPADAPSPLEIFRAALNLSGRSGWLRCLAWMLSALRPSGPYPILILQGPPGSGKSLAARTIRGLIDPSSSPLNATPSSVRDLLTLARHNWILAFDHISTLSPLVADALCRLSCGLGMTLREISGPANEPVQQYVRRPVLLTVTDRFSCPPEIAARALIVDFPAVAAPRHDDDILAPLDDAWPAILGAFCTALSTALRRLPTIQPPPAAHPGTLAWAMAASPAFGSTDEEMQQALAAPPPPHPLVDAVRTLLDERNNSPAPRPNSATYLDPAPPVCPPRASHKTSTTPP